jgi:hypothetical protein
MLSQYNDERQLKKVPLKYISVVNTLPPTSASFVWSLALNSRFISASHRGQFKRKKTLAQSSHVELPLERFIASKVLTVTHKLNDF